MHVPNIATAPATPAEPIRRRLAITVLVWAVATLPFLDKAFHIDDDSFLAVARQVAADPLRPYSFHLTFFQHASGWIIHHPPLVPLYLAAVSALDGGRQREMPLHLAVSLFVALAAFSLYGLAERFHAPPAFTAGAVMLSPAVLPGTNLMVDVPVLALASTAILLHVRGVDTGSRRRLVLAGVVAGLALLTKYNAIVVLPLCALYSTLQGRRSTALFALVPAALFALWCLHNLLVYGRLHVFQYVPVAVRQAHGLADPITVALVVLGAAVCWIPLVVRGDLFTILAACAAVPLGALLATGARDSEHGTLFVANALLLVAGLGRRAFAAFAARRRTRIALDARARDAVFLGAWCAAALAFTWYFPPFPAVRHYVLVLPPLVLLAAAGASHRGCALALAVTAATGVVVGAADAEYADCYRTAARQIAALPAPAPRRVWYLGKWGWDVYAERAGMRYLGPDADVARGDLLVVPRGVWRETPDPRRFDRFHPLRTLAVPRRLPLRTGMDTVGFYYQSPDDVPYALTSRPDVDTFEILVAG